MFQYWLSQWFFLTRAWWLVMVADIAFEPRFYKSQIDLYL